MTTKDYYSSMKDNPNGFVENNSSGVEVLQRKKDFYSRDDLTKNTPSSYLNIENGNKYEKFNAQEKSNTSGSTLSLHIAAYENAIESTFTGSDDGESIVTKSKALKQTFDGLSNNAFKNPFEFPRQQNDKVSEPEVSQFRASQRLFNPNSTPTLKDEFYNSLDAVQKQMFEQLQRQHDEEILEITIALHDKKEECEELAVEIGKLKSGKEQNQKPRKGTDYNQTLKDELMAVGINFDDENQQPVPITNYIYYRLLKLYAKQPSQKRLKLLQLLGISSHQNNPKVLPASFFPFFDQSFLKAREKARSNKKLPNFDNGYIEFPTKYLPFMPTTVTKSQNENEGDNNFDMPPSLEAIALNTGEPSPKRSRVEPKIDYVPLTANAESQTDLKLENVLEMEESKRKLKSLKQKVTYHKGIVGSLKEANKDYEKLIADLEDEGHEFDEKLDQMKNLQLANGKLNDEVRERDEIIAGLSDQLENQEKGKKFFLKNKSGKFTVEAHTCFSRLISQASVSQDKVGIAIIIVADLFKILIDAVPSRWTVGRDVHMIQSLNCEYIAIFINECSNITFLSDETTKFFKKLQAIVFSGKNDRTGQNFVLHIGYGEVPTKSAERCLQEFKLLLSNVAKIGGFDVEKFIQKTVINIRNLQGDQAATTKLLYELFIATRAFYLENSDLDEATKESLKRVNKFFCMLHILSNSSAIVFNALLNHEKFATNNEEATDAAVLWVLNEVPRNFGKRSSGKHASAGQWQTLAKEMELTFAKIDSNQGHRFIIRFIIASEIVYNREDIISFLENLGNNDENLINLKNALQNDLIILHLHILALLGALILQPMWQLCEASESVLQMGLYAPALIKYLKELIVDPMLLFTLNSPFNAFPAAAPKENSKASAFLASLKERPIPVGGSEVVGFVVKPLLEYFEKQLQPFLTGIYASPDIALERETAGAPLTNMACESGFGYIDRLFSTKPNMTTYNRSAYTVAAKNRLFEYITKLPQEEQNAMYLRAMNNKKLSAQLAAEKSQQIHRENVEHIERLALKQQLEKQKKEAKRKQIARDLRECGFWLTVPEMDAALKDLPKATAVKHIKANIRFRKVVWSPAFTPKNLLQFSYQKHTYTHAELEANLKAVIAADFTNPDADANYTSDSEED
uniref:Uncharacterized protein n=1 Tax=Panagrolaimus davidi TaxID=227884 RepID=A0A914PHQ2_9BILA